MKILHLTLKKKWFELIASGSKTVEYREVKPYWQQRLTRSGRCRQDFDEIHFTNGYGPAVPFMRVAFGGLRILDALEHKPLHGEELPRQCFAIDLGDVLEVRR